jgi:hypothetical protein
MQDVGTVSSIFLMYKAQGGFFHKPEHNPAFSQFTHLSHLPAATNQQAQPVNQSELPVRPTPIATKPLTDYEKILTYLHERAEVLTMELRDLKADSPAQRAKVQEKRSEIENLLACISEASHELHKEKLRLSAEWKALSPREVEGAALNRPESPESEKLKATAAHMTQTLANARTDMHVLKTLMRLDEDKDDVQRSHAEPSASPDQRVRIITAMLESGNKP